MSKCSTCSNPKATVQCGVCACPQCKDCAQFLDSDSLAFMNVKPADLQHDTFCLACYQEKVAPALDQYEETMELAKQVNVFFKTQGKETRFIRRTEKRIEVRDCDDKDETVMRLAFLAVQAGFNAIIDVDLNAEKVRMGGWQTSKWHGTAVPARVDEATLARKFISAPN